MIEKIFWGIMFAGLCVLAGLVSNIFNGYYG